MFHGDNLQSLRQIGLISCAFIHLHLSVGQYIARMFPGKTRFPAISLIRHATASPNCRANRECAVVNDP